MKDIIFAKLLAIHRQHRRLVLFPKFLRNADGLLAVGSRRIEHHNIGLADLLQFLHGLLFRIHVICPRQISDTSVCCHHNADRRMIPNDFFRTDGRRLHKRNLMVEPWRMNHTVHTSFHVSCGSVHHKADTVNQTDFNPRIIFKRDLCRVFRNKLRFRRHDGFSLCRLG